MAPSALNEQPDGREPCRKAPPSLYDTDFTAKVIAATGPSAHPRLAKIMPSLLRHLHDFAREVHLTAGEWMAAVELINEAGRMSNDRRNETQLLCDVLGLESLVDKITSKQQAHQQPREIDSVTSSAILGPFHRLNAPILDRGDSIISPSLLKTSDDYRDNLTHLTGRVLDAGGKPISGAVVDVWHAAPNGMYEQQDAHQPDMHLRGRFITGPDGSYSLYCLRPPPYPIPDDGPAGKLLKLLDRHPFRPAHIHFIVSEEHYRTLTTQLFDAEDPYLGNDSVFAVKRDLVASFEQVEDNERGARWKVTFDVVLCNA
ncbi:dioxygenase [Plectosphaerella plurivora]|uniref:Dioxygenase n=1 Tax=Plectosphaerella plurivora TaxID=936078 RepID=A0A9P8VJV5_9PEZI|nr:dioxygenase [Plectosphaerella plurivora]